MPVLTRFHMEVNPENLDSLKGMILHDSFMLDVGNSVKIRAIRVVGGMLYLSIIDGSNMVFTPFGHSFKQEYTQNEK